jgi:hypothetical protein
MFVWSLIVGPAMKKIVPAKTAAILRERSLFIGGLGWPALAVLVITGGYLLSFRGVTLDRVLSGAAFAGTQGSVLAVKLSAVALMVLYQAVFGHRSAPVAIYFNKLLALIVLGASVVLVRGWVAYHGPPSRRHRLRDG